MWYAKPTGGYAQDSPEALANMQAMADLLTARGWTLNAVAALAGNIGGEGGYNPWRWQSDSIPSVNDSPWTNRGYGLVQFTPGGKYINAAQSYPGYGPNFSDQSGLATDGQAQVLFVDEQADYYSTSAYPLSYAEFKASTESTDYLTAAWMHNYERPASYDTLPARQAAAAYWFTVLTGGGGAKIFPIYLFKGGIRL